MHVSPQDRQRGCSRDKASQTGLTTGAERENARVRLPAGPAVPLSKPWSRRSFTRHGLMNTGRRCATRPVRTNLAASEPFPARAALSARSACSMVRRCARMEPTGGQPTTPRDSAYALLDGIDKINPFPACAGMAHPRPAHGRRRIPGADPPGPGIRAARSGAFGKGAIPRDWMNPYLIKHARRRIVRARFGFGARFGADTQDLIQRCLYMFGVLLKAPDQRIGRRIGRRPGSSTPAPTAPAPWPPRSPYAPHARPGPCARPGSSPDPATCGTAAPPRR
jgi:hypothetical protein